MIFHLEPYAVFPAAGASSHLPQQLRLTATFAQLTRVQPSVVDLSVTLFVHLSFCVKPLVSYEVIQFQDPSVPITLHLHRVARYTHSLH